MKRKPNPIRMTVENWISRRPKDKNLKPKITLKAFFEDLENRGPVNFKSDQVFRKWTKKIRQDMTKAKTWIQDGLEEKSNIAFVQEYVSRLQAEFWKLNIKFLKSHHVRDRISYWDCHNDKIKYLGLYKYTYLKIRVFGLRSKIFCLLNSVINSSVSYRHTVVQTHITRYSFGKEYVEDWRATYLAEFYNHKHEFYYCRPFKLTHLFDRYKQ